MNNLPKFITFTGADDKTSVYAMAALSDLYPIEWGILLSDTRAGSPRYPSSRLIRPLSILARYHANLKFSAHLCGKYARQIGEHGGTDAYRYFIDMDFSRIQVNGQDDAGRIADWSQSVGIRAIMQSQGEFPNSDKVDWLFDASGGKGIYPGAWPAPVSDALVGYAGGLSPLNVAAAVSDIGSKCSNYWIDMETGVRDEGGNFSVDICRKVCEAVYGSRSQ
jgi:hypothetical protein